MPLSMFARIGTIKGESRDARHKDEIEVLSWSWGVSQSATGAHGGGGGAGKAAFHDLVLTHHVDTASPLLMKACATGQHVPTATISVRRPGRAQHDHLVITMTDVLVASVSTTAGAEEDTTTEVVVLTFAKVDLEYKPQRPDGALDAGVHFRFDVRTQKEG